MKSPRHHGRAKPLAWIYFTFLSIRHFLCLITLATTLSAQSLTEQDCTIQLQDTGEKILNWTGHVGRTYFIQSSPDLANWSWAPNIEAGKNRPMSYEVDGPASAGFYRLQYTDLTAPNLEAADFDGDGLSNLAEITQRPRPTAATRSQSLQASSVLPVQNGTRKISSKSTRAIPSEFIQTNPLKTDTDNDGLTDKWEEDHQLDPTDDGSYNPNNGPNGDPDQDDLDNLSEIQNNTDPFRFDTDYDYLPDGWEIQHGLIPAYSIQIDDTWVYGYDGVNGSYGDPDADGIQNQYEYILGLDAQNANSGGTPDVTKDRDGDGLPDWWEAQTGAFRWSYQNQRYEFQRRLDWERDDRTEDTDADGLTNFAEYQDNTDPFRFDTDYDYLPDGWEIQHGLVAASSIQVNGTWFYGYAGVNGSYGDPDADGIQNQYEYALNFDPQSANTHGTPDATRDRDGDGMPDFWEAQTGTFQWSSQNQRYELQRKLDWDVNDASGDLDYDKINNLAEFNAGTNPNKSDTDSDGFHDALELEYEFLDPTVWNDPNGDHDLDGMPDLFEAIYGLNLEVNDASLDPDNDDLTNFEEFQFRSPPNNPDIDHDGLKDSQERSEATDPWKWDSDGDQLPDGWEVKHGLNPTKLQSADLDREPDGLKDSDEVRFGTDPFKKDSDGDGVGDGDEVANKTDPMDDEWGGIPPAAPSNVVETQNTDGTTSFTWQDNSHNEKSFRIYRHLSDGTKQLLGEVKADTTSFIYTPPPKP